MEPEYLIDTNVVIDNFGNMLPEKAKAFVSSFVPVVSVVTKIEVLGWPNATKQQLSPLYGFMETAILLTIDESVIEKTISIRQAKKIGLGDAILAATALRNNLKLMTHNTKDFKDIEGLQLIDPYEL
jgi:predicted nucleic acid-binding protein